MFRWLAVTVFATTALLAQERLEQNGPTTMTLRLGDSAQVELRVIDPEGQVRELQVPQVDGLSIRVGGPMRQMASSIIGRTRTQQVSVTWQLELQPTREGAFVVPPFPVWTGSREQNTRELRIEAKPDLQAAELGYLDVRVEPARVYVHEPIRVHLEFGVQQGLRLVQEVADRYRYFDIEVTAPWLTEFPSGESMAATSPPGNAQIVICNRKLFQAAYDPEHEREGKRWQRFVVELAFLPTQAGTIVLSAPSLRYHLIRRAGSNDLFQLGSRPLTANYVVAGRASAVEVLPIPEVGRPQPYFGAVGRFTIEAALDRERVKVGTSVKLTLTVRGQGNLEFLRVPVLDDLPGFHKLGQTESKRGADKVEVTYDLTPLSTDVHEVPAIGWNYFDTTPGVERFVVTATRALPLAVQPLPPGEGLAPLPETVRKAVLPGVDDVFDLPSLDGPPVLVPTVAAWWVWLLLLGPWLFAGLGLAAARGIAQRRADVVGSRSRGAARACERALQAGTEPLAALADYVGARLGVTCAAVITADLSDQLQAAGLDQLSAAEVAAAIERGTAARYGGGDSLGQDTVRDLVQRLERARFGVGLLGWLLLPALLCTGGEALRAQAIAMDPVAAYRAGDYAGADAAFSHRYAVTGDRRLLQARGNCQVRLGDLPRALWAYECARLGLPRDAELLANLQFVARKLDLVDGPRGMLDELETWRSRLDRGEQALAGAIAMLIAAGCLLFARRRLVAQWVGALALLLASAFAVELLWLAPGRAPVAIALRGLELTAEPKAGMAATATVRAGVKVEVLGGSEGGFVRVRVAEHLGFVARELIAVVE